jgi:acylphosphatase
MDTIIRRLSIRGRVQGVGYRAFLADRADALGLRGWVRNRGDGSVEAMVAGAPDLVARLVDAAKAGPAGGRVETVAAEPVEDNSDGLPEPFAVWPTL